MSDLSRSKQRENAFILVFEHIFNPELTLEELADIVKETELFEITDFTLQLTSAVFEHTDDIDAAISEYLKGWKLARLSKVTLALLRLAAAELLYIDNIPSKVTANEAVELAKTYGDEGDPKYINGVLGAFIRARNIQ